MQTWIALFRGINVGGRNKVPMAALATTLEKVNCRSVRTYIQSGNVIFDHASKSKRTLTKYLVDATEQQFGFRPTILLLTEKEFNTANESNPFIDAIEQPKTLHFFFLAASPDSPDTDAIATLATSTERWKLSDAMFYLHAPEGFGRSKLAKGVEQKLGVPVTARNYTTIQNLTAMLGPV